MRAEPADPERARRRRWAGLAGALLLCAATLLIYLPTPGDYWIRYDNEALLREPRLRALGLEGPERLRGVVEIFTSAHGDLYQPLLSFSIAIDYALFGADRTGFHWHALALHLACVLGVFALALRLVGVPWAAALGTLLVAAHPILVETTSWIVNRTFLTATAWIVIGCHAYLSYARDPGRRRWLVAATLAFSISLLGKTIPSVLLVPFAIDCWLARPLSRWLFVEKLPLAVAVFAVAALNLHVSQATSDPETLGRAAGAVLAEAPAAFLLTAANLVWPAHLSIFYASGQTWQLLGVRALAVALAALGVGAVGVRDWRRGVRGPLIAAALWCALLVPFLLVGSYRDTSTADRYAYLGTLLLAPGIAAALAARRETARGRNGPRARASARAGLAGAALLALALGIQAHTLARRWSSEAALWQVVIARSPHPTAYAALGEVYRARGDWPAAVAAYEQALALLPREPIASQRYVYHLSTAKYAIATYEVLRRRGEADPERYLDIAVRAAREGAQRWPRRSEFDYELGRALLAQHEYAAAAQALTRVVAREPTHARAFARLGLAYRGTGDLEGAVAAARDALRIEPRYSIGLELLANLYWEMRRPREAAAAFLAWAEAYPEMEAAQRGFAASLAELEREGATQHAAELRAYHAERFPDAVAPATPEADAAPHAPQTDPESSSGSM